MTNSQTNNQESQSNPEQAHASQVELELTENQEYQIKQLGLSKNVFKGKNALPLKTLELLSKNEILWEHKYDAKDKQNPHSLFISVLEGKNLPEDKKGLHVSRILQALTGGPHEQEAVKKMLGNVDEATGEISKTELNKHFETLDEAKDKDLKVSPEEATGSTAEQIKTVELQAEQSNPVAAEIKKTGALNADTSEDTIEDPSPLALGKWEGEKLDIKLQQKLNAIIPDYNRVQGDLLHLVTENKQLVIKSENPKLSEKERSIMHAKIKANEIELKRLTVKAQILQEKFDPLNKELNDYLLRNTNRYWMLEMFFKRCGIDLRNVGKLKVWKLDEGALDLGGIKVDAQGLAQKTFSTIEIEKVSFEGTEHSTAESPGVLMIHYKEEGSDTVIKENSANFINKLNALEAHEEIKSLDELNPRIASSTGNKPLAVGDNFWTGRLTGFDKNDNQIYDTIKFNIESIDEAAGTITLDAPQEKIRKEVLSNAIDSRLYFDRIQATFSFGEFGRFLVQNDFQRDMGDESLREIAERMTEHNNTYAKSLSDEAEAYSLTIPRPGEPPQSVWVHDDRTGKRHRGTVENKAQLGEPDDIVLKYKDPYYEQPPVSEFDYQNVPQTPQPTIEMPLSPEASNLELDEGNIYDREEEENQLQGSSLSRGSAPLNEGSDPNGGQSLIEEAQSGSGGPQAQEKNQEDPNVYKEALPYSEIHKVGGMDTKKRSYLKTIRANTRVLCADDIWELIKSGYDYYTRRFERTQKEAYSKVAENVPYFGTEMTRINQAAENEEVNQFKESIEQEGVWEVQGRMRTTKNRDEMKACFQHLSSKGQIRWDDIGMWSNLNRFLSADKAIPIPRNGDPATWLNEKDKRTGMNFMPEALDSLWGEGTFNDWFSQNKSGFDSGLKKYYEEGKELEGLNGGHGQALSTLLERHKRGEFVDPQQYEGLIQHSIEAGKSSMQAKLYYMIEGVAAENPQGQTILSFDRMAHINSDQLMRFPILEYLCAPVLRSDGETHRFTIDDYKKWAEDFDGNDKMNTEPNARVDRFLWKYVIPSDDTQNRINKDMRNGENLDHDDMFAYLPPATEQIIEDSCRATTGNKKFLTVEGYANVFPGFSQYIRSLAESDLGKSKNKLKEAVKSYVRFEGITNNRYKKEEGSRLQRMDDATLKGGTIVTPLRSPLKYINELNTTVQEIVRIYDDDKLSEIADKIYNWKTGDVARYQNERDKQRDIDFAFQEFGKHFDRVIKSDDGAKMEAVIKGANLYGMPTYVSDEEKDLRKANAERRAPTSDDIAA
jgi:hypothetical protein